MSGKWHLGFYKWEMTPTFRGFDSFVGFYSGGEDYFTHESGGSYDFRRDPSPNCGKNCSTVGVQDKSDYSTTVFTTEVSGLPARPRGGVRVPLPAAPSARRGACPWQWATAPCR